MIMIEYYTPLKLLHVTAALTSGALFLARGIGVQTGAGWAMARPVRYLSYGIDVVLLAAALALLATLPSATFANGWLTAKLWLLAAYIGLGTFALKRGRTARVRRFCLVAALLVYLSLLAVARSHDPLGPLRYLFG